MLAHGQLKTIESEMSAEPVCRMKCEGAMLTKGSVTLLLLKLYDAVNDFFIMHRK